jgi:hypothetical protein
LPLLTLWAVGTGVATVWCQVANNLGCTTRDTILVDFGPLFTSHLSSDYGVMIYPNPASNLFNVELDGFSGRLGESNYVSNLHGQLIFSDEWKLDQGKLRKQIEVSAFSHGCVFHPYCIRPIQFHP